MQTVLVELIENFEFTLPPTKPKILRVPVGVMPPMIEDHLQESVTMPLTVRALKA
jgi:hypothetical protein